MKPEKQQLIHELLEGENRRESTLRAATAVLRRRRQWRVARQVLALLGLALATILLVQQNRHPRSTVVQINPAATAAKPPVALTARSLTDAELLALFPNTPVALATLPNGKKLLIFPRPADAKKYVTRL